MRNADIRETCACSEGEAIQVVHAVTARLPQPVSIAICACVAPHVLINAAIPQAENSMAKLIDAALAYAAQGWRVSNAIR